MYELAGKRVILFFEGYYYDKRAAGFLNVLKSSHARMKGTDNEFEVIYITSSEESLYEEIVFGLPWLFALESELLPIDLSLYCCYCRDIESVRKCSPGWCGISSTLLAFDRDGKIVSKKVHPYFSRHIDFPFCDANMEKVALSELTIHFEWDELDRQYSGLLYEDGN